MYKNVEINCLINIPVARNRHKLLRIFYEVQTIEINA